MTRARDVANLIGSGNYSSTTFTATAGQTAFTISHTQGFVQVFMNGLLLDETVDYTSNGSAITLTSGAAAGDEIEVVAYNTFSVGDAIAKSGGTFTGDVTFSGTTSGIDMNGTELVLDADGDTSITADTDDRIDFKIAGSDRGNLHYDGNDFFSLESNDYLTLVQNQTAERALIFGPTYFKPYNSHDNTLDLGIGAARWKDLYLSGGAYLGGTGSSNYLDDYEEGTWSPTVGAVTGQTQPTVTYGGTNYGNYTKIGSVVVASFYIGPFQFNSTGQGSTFAVKNFPFNADGNKQSTTGGVQSHYYLSWARPDFVSMRHYTGNDFGFLSMNNGGTWGWELCSAAGTGTFRYIIGSMTYFTAS